MGWETDLWIKIQDLKRKYEFSMVIKGQKEGIKNIFVSQGG